MDHNTKALENHQEFGKKEATKFKWEYVLGRQPHQQAIPTASTCTYSQVVPMSGCWHDQSDLLIASGNGFLPGFSVATDWVQQIAVLCHITPNVKYRGNVSRSTVIVVSLLNC